MSEDANKQSDAIRKLVGSNRKVALEKAMIFSQRHGYLPQDLEKEFHSALDGDVTTETELDVNRGQVHVDLSPGVREEDK